MKCRQARISVTDDGRSVRRMKDLRVEGRMVRDQEFITLSTSNNARVLAAVPSGVVPPMGFLEFASVSPLYSNSISLCHCFPKISLAWIPPTSSAAENAKQGSTRSRNVSVGCTY